MSIGAIGSGDSSLASSTVAAPADATPPDNGTDGARAIPIRGQQGGDTYTPDPGTPDPGTYNADGARAIPI